MLTPPALHPEAFLKYMPLFWQYVTSMFSVPEVAVEMIFTLVPSRSAASHLVLVRISIASASRRSSLQIIGPSL